MDRVACRFRLLPGMQDEYKKRHDNIWPEMTSVMNSAGIHNYTIWNVGEELFGYYEVENYNKSIEVLNASDIVKKWNDYMKEIIEYDINHKTGRMQEMKLMFYHK